MANPITYYNTIPQIIQEPPTTVGAYSDALQNAQNDYGFLSNAYKQLYGNGTVVNQSPVTYNPIQYQESPDVSQSLSALSSLTNNGGYSNADINALRARAVSPVRSIYANAQSDLQRQRSLQGGYSPNYNAVAAKMAREQSDQISQQLTNVNATLAQNIAANKLTAAPAYASAAGAEAGRSTDVNEFNASNATNIAEFNAQQLADAKNKQLQALQGFTSLYGTTPGAANTFGNQALAAAGLNSNNLNAGLNRNIGGQTALLSRVGGY